MLFILFLGTDEIYLTTHISTIDCVVTRSPKSLEYGLNGAIFVTSLLYKASYRSGVEKLDYTRFLDDQVVFQRACNLMYSAMI